MSRAHVYYSTKQQSWDAMINGYCTAKENCRCQAMLQALGTTENHPQCLPCCDSCDSTKSPSNLAFEAVAHATGTRKRRRAARDIDEGLKTCASEGINEWS